MRFFKRKRYDTRQIEIAESSEIIDPRIKFDVLTRELVREFKFDNTINPVFSIPLSYNDERGVFEIVKTPSIMTARAQAYYYSAPPALTVPGFYSLRLDSAQRLVTHDEILESALASRAQDKLRVSVVDPANVTDTFLSNPGGAETYTTTPLVANAVYYGPSRDFANSRLSAMGVMGYADQPSADNGVYIQLSHDNTNWDYRGATATLSAAGAVALAQVITARYARVVWVNGPTAQSTFRLGGRYMIAGSELPVFSPAPAPQPEPVCVICGFDMTETSDFFYENGIVYCPKCYANKRWKELKEKERATWEKALRGWLKHAAEHERTRVRTHAPDEVIGG